MNGMEMVATTTDVGFVTDENGVIRGWNAEAERAFDLPADEVLGRSCHDVLKGRDAYGNDYCGPSCPLMRMTIDGRPVRRCQIFFSGTDGIARPYSITTLLLRGVPPVDPAIIHLLHPAVWDRRHGGAERGTSLSGNHQRGELTKRELEVLGLLARGRGTRAIARSLRISPSTVGNHVQHVLYKLNVHSRLEAVTVARELRLI